MSGRLGNIWSPGFDPVGRREVTGLFGEPGEGCPLEDKWGCLGPQVLRMGTLQVLCAYGVPILDTRVIPTFNTRGPQHLWRGGTRWQ